MKVGSWSIYTLMAPEDGGDEGGSGGLAELLAGDDGGDAAPAGGGEPADSAEASAGDVEGDDAAAEEAFYAEQEAEPEDASADLAELLLSEEPDTVESDEGDDEPADPDVSAAEGLGQDPPPAAENAWLQQMIPGFQGSPQEAIQALLARQNQLQPWAQMGQQLAQQQPQVQPQQTQRSLVPKPPHQGDARVEQAAKLYSAGHASFEKLPAALQEQARERAAYEDRVAGMVMGDPEGHFREFVLPLVEQVIAPLRDGFYGLTSQRWIADNADVIKTAEDKQAVARLIKQGAAPGQALQALQRDKREAALQAELAELRAERDKVSEQKKTQDAIAQDRRGRAGRGRRRRGRTVRPLSEPRDANEAFARALLSKDTDYDDG